jgi:membrane-associated phospholipid phosphatase
MKDTFARLTSNILNPFVISVIVLILLTLESTSNLKDAIEWMMIAVAISVVPLLITVVCLVRFKRLDGFFTNPREQRNIVYIAASLLGAVDCALFWYFKAPELLAVTFTSALITVLVFTLINHFWKISIHTAFIAAAGSVLVIVYGVAMVWTLVFVPLVGWSRIALKQHSLWQVVAGGLTAAVIVSAVFWGFGLV